MKISFRLAAAGIASAMALTLAACSNDTGSGGESGAGDTVTGIFDIQYKAALDPIVADFEKANPGVTVDIDYQGGDLNQVILTQLQGGTAPDVLLTFPGGDANTTATNVAPLAKQGRILPIDADWADDVPDTWKSSVDYDGKLYAFPGALQPLAAIYNQSLLEELGLTAPTTLDEVYKFCGDAEAKGVYAYAQGLGDTSAGPQMLSFGQMASLLYGADGTWDAGLADGSVSYTDSPWVSQFETYQKMFDSGCFGEGSLGRSRQQGQEAVAKRQALGLVDVGAVLAPIQAGNPNDTFEVAAMPATNEGTSSITALPGYTLTVNAKAKNPEMAKKFVVFAGEPAESAKFATGFGSVPLIPNTEFKAPEALVAFNELVISDKTATLAQIQPEVQTALNTGVQSMLLGNDTPQSVAKKMQDAYTTE